MSTRDYAGLVAGQRAYFKAGNTRPVAWRIEQLNAIKTMVDESRDAMYEALWHDLRRNNTDADLMDVDCSIREAQYALDHLHEWMKVEHEPTPLVMQPGHVRVRREPLGVTLIIGAWNEPFMLTVGPLVAAIAAGNTAVLKPSEIAAASAAGAGRHGAEVPRHRGGRGRAGRRPGDDGAARAEVGHDLLHRQPAGRQDHPPGGGEEPDAVRCSSWAARTRRSCTRRPTSR